LSDRNSGRSLASKKKKFLLTLKMNDDKKLTLARALFVLALFVGLLSAFQDWEMVNSDRLGQPDICRNFNTVRRILSWGLLSEYEERYLFDLYSWIPMHRFLNIFYHSLVSITFLILLASIFLARFLSYSKILWWLWMFSHVTWNGFMIYIYQKHAPVLYITGFGAGYLGCQPHICWLSGFYFGCAALGVHLCAMLLLFFPHRKKPVM
jgi:hypothetical protein